MKENGAVVGSVGLIPSEGAHTALQSTEMEIGYWIGVPYWGQGLIPEAVREILRHAFEDLSCTAVWGGYYEGNFKSQRVLEKCGFVFHHTEPDTRCPLMSDIRTQHFMILTRETWRSGVIIRPLSSSEISFALSLVWDVFSEFEAPEYSDEGIASFRAILDDEGFITGLRFYGAFVSETLAGVLAMREGNRISLFFVRKEYQRQGLGKRLFMRMKQDYDVREFEVNSSPYAVEIYRHLGFTETGFDEISDGIRFIPMIYRV